MARWADSLLRKCKPSWISAWVCVLQRRLHLSTGATDAAAKARDAASSPRREEDRAALADLHSNIAEKDAEIERLKKALYEAEAENLTSEKIIQRILEKIEVP